MSRIQPTFKKILDDAMRAHGMTPNECLAPRPPEEVRLLLSSKTNERQTQDKLADQLGSADAI